MANGHVRWLCLVVILVANAVHAADTSRPDGRWISCEVGRTQIQVRLLEIVSVSGELRCRQTMMERQLREQPWSFDNEADRQQLRKQIDEIKSRMMEKSSGDSVPVAVWLNSQVTAAWPPLKFRQFDQSLQQFFTESAVANPALAITALRPGDELKLASRAIDVLLPAFDKKKKDAALLIDLRAEASFVGILDGGQLFWVRNSVPGQLPVPLAGWNRQEFSATGEQRDASLDQLLRQPCASYRDTKPAVGAANQVVLFGDMSAAWSRYLAGPQADGTLTTQVVTRNSALSSTRADRSLAAQVRRADFVTPLDEWQSLSVTAEQFAVSAEILQSVVNGLDLSTNCLFYMDERMQFAVDCAIRWEQTKRWPKP